MFRYILAIVVLPSTLYAQHPAHRMPKQAPMKSMSLMMIDPLGVSMERMGSGTTWIPDAVAAGSARNGGVVVRDAARLWIRPVRHPGRAAGRRPVRLAELGDAYGEPRSARRPVPGTNDDQSG